MEKVICKTSALALGIVKDPKSGDMQNVCSATNSFEQLMVNARSINHSDFS